jgi:hypothetical protein
VKGLVKIAYWDTEKSGSAPGILGEIRGTPTIKLLRPKRKAKTNKQKDVVDYNMERKADDCKCDDIVCSCREVLRMLTQLNLF